jgi:Leucine-rich repeat (LRR) protein
LFKLDLQRNYELGGNIPTELCRLEELVVLELNDNSHTGTIPECMGKMTALNTLFLSNNALRGSLPARLAGAKSLAMLKLDDNMLTGSPLSVLNSLTNLFHLFVSGNQFTGNINGDFLKKHEKLLLLDMSHNEFTSNEFPSQLLELTSLALVDISQNRLGGQFPPEINLNNNLGTFSAYNNSFVGTFPSTISNLRNLAFLDLSQNQLGGKMPDTLGEFTRLSTLFLSDNPFSAGTIPESIVNMTALQEVSLRNTNRNGEVPSFSELNSKLYLLDLSSNQLTGLVPETLGSVPMLAFLLLNDNPGISGGLPSSFGYSKFLQNAFFDGTNLEGDFSFLCTINANTNITFVREFYADCKPSSSTSAKVACSCCECCTSGVPGGCSEPAATNLDLQWEESFARRNKPDFDI